MEEMSTESALEKRICIGLAILEREHKALGGLTQKMYTSLKSSVS
jgi:hypothetical protein